MWRTIGSWRIPPTLIAFALALMVYSLAAGPTLARQSIAPHYVYLADALLHGRLDVTRPPSSYDLLVANGRAYVAGSPMPAILLMPVVAILGAGVSDVAFGVIVGALNVALAHSLFKRWWLTLLFAFGTPHLYLAALGSVWFNAHVVAISFGLLATRAALGESVLRPFDFAQGRLRCAPPSAALRAGLRTRAERWRWFLSGLCLACAGFARPILLFGASFFVVLIWLTWARRDRVVTLASFATAVALGLAAHGLYNAARFGSPGDFGYQYTAGAPNITSTYARYGGFSPRFLPCNLFVSILSPPQVNGYVPPITYDVCGYLLDGVNLSDASAPIAPNPLGMSLFLVTPAFVLLFAARGRDPLTLAAWAGLLATTIPLWLYHNTGSLQFGYRYWMDAAPMWLLLLSTTLVRRGSLTSPHPRPQVSAPGAFDETFGQATGLGRRPSPITLLILASIAINVWGFLWMFEKFVGMTWFEVMRG